MEEKTDIVPPVDQLPALDVAVEAGIDTEDSILPIDTTATQTESTISSASTETVASTEVSHSQSLTTEAKTIETTETETSTSEVFTSALTPVESVISSDALSVADVLTSVDDSQTAEELTSANVKATAEIDAAAAKASVDTANSSSVVCELEEELKRLHEGDPVEHKELVTEILPIKETPAIEKSVAQEKPVIPLQTVPVQAVPQVVKLVVKPVNVPLVVEEPEPIGMLSTEDVAKDPVLIKNAQEEIKKFDVLVCGKCHEVSYFIEEFQSHKSKCSGKSGLLSTCEGESKPQVWGFTLWKNKQNKSIKEGETVPSSWIIYQKWCKLPQTDKDAWITAGQALQFCSKIGSAKITEIKPNKVQPKVEKDPLALDGFDSNKENSVVGNSPVAAKSSASEVIKKSIIKPVRLNNDVTILPSTKNGDFNSNKALRTVRSTEKREYVVERIVAKRFNPKRKTWEYQIKWENFPSEDNTWEPISNLNHCKQMVEEFEEQLKKLKAEKAKQQAAGLLAKGRGRTVKPFSSPMSTPSSSFSGESTPGRPQRTSKQKALNQVKAWCGNISDTDEGNGVKRAFEDEDSDDSFEKKMKYEEFSDDSDVDVKPKPPLRRIAPKPTMQIIKNGIGKLSPIPQNVLIPDANGVVRINQKQLPSLSTGVYIMSKTAGIIKLDSTTSKVATSGGQTIVKVAPKIGQTQIKIVKKDGATTTTKQIIQVTPNKGGGSTPTKIYKPIITKVKKPPELSPKPAATKIIVRPKEEVKIPEPLPEEESDDGLEELPFPEDLPPPEPASPEPKDFVLDPFTGKIAGQEYPEVPVAEPEDVKMDPEDTSLENIVKLAAADITEDDLKTDPVESPMDTEPIVIPEEVKPIKSEQTATVTSTPKVVMTSTIVKSEPSLLNKALRGSAVVRKGWLGTSPQPKVQTQRVLNQSVASKGQSTFIRSMPHTSNFLRTRPVAPKPKFNIAASSNIIRTQHEVSPRNVYSKVIPSGVTRKIGNTTIRSTSTGYTTQRPVARIVQSNTNVRKVSPRKESMLIRTQVSQRSAAAAASRPKTVISMPSLIGDDEPLLSLTQAEVTKSAILPVAKNVPTTEAPAAPVTIAKAPEETPLADADASASSLTTDISSFTLADNENPIYITGDDGTVYQVAGQNEHGQTILLTQGSDGQQQCLLVTNEVAESMETSPEEIQEDISLPEIATDVTEPLSVKTDVDASDQVVAQVVRAEPPSPGGTHKVVVMLPDGNLMITQVSPEEYASLELE